MALMPSLYQDPPDWDFRDADTKEGTHVVHSYPAMMIPQVARHLIARLRRLNPESRTLLDPFCGAGTVLVEAARQGLSAFGNDLNPLALAIAAARTTPIDETVLADGLDRLKRVLVPEALSTWDGAIPTFRGRDFWFKREVSRALAWIRDEVRRQLTDPAMRQLAEVAFSETVRLVSNTRNSEFKLYRMPDAKLAAFSPDVIRVFHRILVRYAEGVRAFNPSLRQAATPPAIVKGDSRLLAGIPDRHFDLMVTSPPYGDSRTTVAYGQFSRLSLEWLGYPAEEARTVDRRLLGGRLQPHAEAKPVPSQAVLDGTAAIGSQDARRAREVESFYRDLDAMMESLAPKLRPGALAAWVVANRTVKQVVLPTNVIIAELATRHGFALVEDLTRNIPSKRMPRANSPTNVPGQKGATMTEEHLVVLRYDGA